MESLRDKVVSQLREQILSNDLEPGTRLRERTLSDLFGVSRVPVREALMVLEADLLVTSSRRADGSEGAGVEVTRFDRNDVAELFDAREALEPLVARLAARHRSEAQLEALRDQLETARRAAETGDNRAGALANTAYHGILVQACGSGLLAAVMAPLQTRIERLFRRTIVGRAPELAEDHTRMLAALADRPAETAALLARLHVVSTRAPSLALFTEQDEGQDAGRADD
ncbi:MAG: GntR family transcriptional regulator [Acidipropionibacterium jensenii]|uniref:GntR family transcriptional regulator n=1 Tax=Acidipropionibacterium jensenii TaxID=1749 RepID=UPI0026498534|nr:GntR family transcriptional regulator [Acidipropionibacterium jensenii]MDN6441802.1 GntR family transcriptional regulator [Acidipropionibacterium jensenii]